MSENELATIAVDISFRIHQGLGPGLLESVYEEAFAYELTKSAIEYTRQEPIKVWYDGVLLNVGFRADFILEEKLLKTWPGKTQQPDLMIQVYFSEKYYKLMLLPTV